MKIYLGSLTSLINSKKKTHGKNCFSCNEWKKNPLHPKLTVITQGVSTLSNSKNDFTPPPAFHEKDEKILPTLTVRLFKTTGFPER